MFCQFCGNEVSSGAKVCPACGKVFPESGFESEAPRQRRGRMVPPWAIIGFVLFSLIAFVAQERGALVIVLLFFVAWIVLAWWENKYT